MSAVPPIVVFPSIAAHHPTVKSDSKEAVDPHVIAPVIEALPAADTFPDIVVSPVMSASHPIVASHVADKSPVISAPSPPVIFPVISAVPPIVAFHVISAFSVTVKLLSTSKFPVISTSHKYHANAEKSPLISVPLDRTNVYNPSNGSESGFVSLIDSSLTSLYCGTNNP
jgi:hypothetical protein